MTTIHDSIAYIAGLMAETDADEMQPVDEYDIYVEFDQWPQVEDVLPYLLHPEPMFRAVAAAVCGCYRITEAASHLVMLTDDADEWVREMARWAMDSIDYYWYMYKVWDVLLLVLRIQEPAPKQLSLF